MPIILLTSLKKFEKKNPHKKWSFAKIDKVGWHFSSMGGFDKFLEKIASYSHVTANTAAARDLNNLKKAVEGLTYFEIDETFPSYVVQKKEELKELGFIDEYETTFR